MKSRNGFVTNSSSSSFVVEKRDLKKKHIKAIKNHIDYANKRLGWIAYHEDAWSIYENDDAIEGYTAMDNFNIYKFMREIGVDLDRVDIRY